MKDRIICSYLRKLFVVLFLMSFARTVFIFCNLDYFSDERIKDVLWAFLLGVRTDISLIALINIPTVFMWFFPAKISDTKVFRLVNNWLFFVINFFVLIPNFIDCAYFRFIFRRSGFEIFSIEMFAQENISVFLHIFADYWYLALLIIACGIILFKETFKDYRMPIQHCKTRCKLTNFAIQFFKLIVCVVCFVFAIRGGWQSKPLKPVDTNALARSIKTSVIGNNSTFNIIHTHKRVLVDNFNFMLPEDAKKIYSFTKVNNGKLHGLFKNKNLFIIILEGFSAEHVGFLDKKYKDFPDRTFTPFLDELSTKSVYFNGFSNGVSSIDALTSILIDIPPMTNTPFMSSAYRDNKLVCGSHFFNANEYNTIFFYGGKKNSCRFDSIRKKAEIAEYFCEDEYDEYCQYKNPWGIDDEEFLQFALRKLNQSRKPFFGTFFTLSSHHPFVIPSKYNGKFPKGEHPIMELIAYADYSLRKFFEEAAKQDWFNNTLFVLCADHINGVVQQFYKHSIGRHSIPIMFYDPSGELQNFAGDRSAQTIQQIDIMPTVLDLFGINDETFMLGTSAFDDNEPHFAISVSDKIYQLIKDGYVLRFGGTKSIGFYKKDDYLLQKNLIDSEEFQQNLHELDLFIKAFLQQYYNALINNKTTVD